MKKKEEKTLMETHSSIYALQGFEDCIVFDEIMEQLNEDFSKCFFIRAKVKEDTE